jgi:hypothetical protein
MSAIYHRDTSGARLSAAAGGDARMARRGPAAGPPRAQDAANIHPIENVGLRCAAIKP